MRIKKLNFEIIYFKFIISNQILYNLNILNILMEKEISTKNSSKEKSTLNILNKKKDNKKIFNNFETYNTSKTFKKDYNYRLNLKKIKNIIKKIDLHSLSLSKNLKNRNLLNKNRHLTKNNKNSPAVFKINFNKSNYEEKSKKLFINKNNKNIPHKIIQNNTVYYMSLTEFTNRLINTKDQSNDSKIAKCNNKYKSNNKYKLYDIIKDENFDKKLCDMKQINNLKKNRMSKINKNMGKNNKNIITHHFKKNFTESGLLEYNQKQSLEKEYYSSLATIKKIFSSSKDKNFLKKSDSATRIREKQKEKDKIPNNKFYKKEQKEIIGKGNSAPKTLVNLNKKQLYLSNNKNGIGSTLASNKENYRNNIPKPINTHYNLSKNNKKNKHNNIRQMKTEIINNIDNLIIKTSSNNFNEEENKYMKTYSNDIEKNNPTNFIDDALINIRGISIAGRDTNNQVKLNQDSYIIKRNINNINNFNIFGVFDGHGFYGNIISNYLKDNLIDKISRHPQIESLNTLEDIYNTLKKDNYEIIKDIFNEIDHQILYKENDIDAKLSGSTCNIIIELGDHLLCANVGDSRAVLIYEDKEKTIINDKDTINTYVLFSLSKDCKPYLPQEKERILKNGGTVRRFRDSSNNEYGPLRAFKNGSDFPGLAMSRSFGDKLGKDIGVISEPLIVENNLNKTVKYIIIASDGIWEYMNSEQIMNIGNMYYAMNDPDNFCKALIKKATELWEKNSTNIDDMTLIVIFFTFL